MDPSTSQNITSNLSTFSLPLLRTGPPEGYEWEGRAASVMSTMTAFNNGINLRDVFKGVLRCIICGNDNESNLEHCHIIMRSEPRVWKKFKREYFWIPREAKDSPEYEPRNGLLMCANHHKSFDAYEFFIRYVPNYSTNEKYHGKAVALDVNHRYTPFPSLFIIHEMRVRGHNPFQPTQPPLPRDVLFQDWILNDALFDHEKGTFNRDEPPTRAGSVQPQSPPPPIQSPTTGAEGSSGDRRLALSPDVIQDILAATRSMPSWKACQIEGTTWTGTAEENIQKYTSIVGAQLQDR